MTASVSDVDLVNDAIDFLQDRPIESLADDTAMGRRFKRVFPTARDAFLEMHPWNFAIKRVALAESSSAPAHGWSKRYHLPGDCIRLLQPRESNEFEGDLLKHTVEGNDILTDQSGPLKVRYIYRNVAYGTWSAQARAAFSLYLATRVAHAVTQKASMLQIAENAFERAYRTAKRLDGLVGSTERPSSQTVLNVRGPQNNGVRYERYNS